MLHSSSERVASFFVANNIISQDDAPVYAYGIELILASMINAIAVLIIGIVLGRIAETTLFLVSFAVLRSYCGGYHAASHLKCFAVLICAYLVNMALLWFIPDRHQLFVSSIFILIGTILIFRYAPVESENKPLDEKEKYDYRSKSRVWCVVIAVIVVIGLLLLPKACDLFFSITLGFMTATVSTATVLLRAKKMKGDLQ